MADSKPQIGSHVLAQGTEASSLQRSVCTQTLGLRAWRQLTPATPVTWGQLGRDSCVLAASGMLETLLQEGQRYPSLSHSLPTPMRPVGPGSLPGSVGAPGRPTRGRLGSLTCLLGTRGPRSPAPKALRPAPGQTLWRQLLCSFWRLWARGPRAWELPWGSS